MPKLLYFHVSNGFVGSFNLNVCGINCLQSVGSGLSLEPPATTEPDEEEDGMSDIIQEVTSFQPVLAIYRKSAEDWIKLFFQVTGLIWSQDLRVQEVRRLLQSSRPVRVNVVQLPEVSDHEYIEEKENKWVQFSLCPN